MLNCAQTDALLDALMDGALTDADRQSLNAHCAGCTACAERLRLTEEMRRMFSETAPELDVPLTAQAAWRGAIRQERASPQYPHPLGGRYRRGAGGGRGRLPGVQDPRAG